jgi:hypothetical protein
LRNTSVFSAAIRTPLVCKRCHRNSRKAKGEQTAQGDEDVLRWSLLGEFTKALSFDSIFCNMSCL